MKINQIKAFAIKLPFRFSFGHSLASRNSSLNVIVRVELEDPATGRRAIGYGESVPRDYVTGETTEGALKLINSDYIPRLLAMTFDSPLDAMMKLEEIFTSLSLHEKPRGASWCAVELAVLDAVCRVNGLSVASLLSMEDAVRLSKSGNYQPSATISSYTTYGAVLPFSGTSKLPLLGMLYFFKLYGFKTVKVKVGRDIDSDLERLKLARQIMGDDAILRIDANCAWTVDETLYFAEKMREFRVESIEQPVPAEDIAGMQRLTRELPETIVADESLLTLKDAKTLIEVRGANAFNIRLSKVGGLVAATRMVDLARNAGVGCLLGAQVGETAILTAAGRAFACVKGPLDNCEGSFNRFLLKSDLSIEDTTMKQGGRAFLPDGPGLGIRIDENKLKRLVVKVPESAVSYAQAAGA
jgi:muconate cycloisomerase